MSTKGIYAVKKADRKHFGFGRHGIPLRAYAMVYIIGGCGEGNFRARAFCEANVRRGGGELTRFALILCVAVAFLSPAFATDDQHKSGMSLGGHQVTLSEDAAFVDLDNGLVTGEVRTDGLDLQLATGPGELITQSTRTTLGIGDKKLRDFHGCDATRYGDDGIDLSSLSPGEYICVRTNKGRLGLLKIEAVSATQPYTLSFSYELFTTKPKLAAFPMAVGECVSTRITEINPGVPGAEAGSGWVSFSNGGVQLAYNGNKSMEKSRAGDPARMCLVRNPDSCPPGDDRGHVYKTTNLRTRLSWTLPDSSHSCGGA